MLGEYRAELSDDATAPLFVFVHGRAGSKDVMWTFKRVLPHHVSIFAPQAPIEDEIGGYSWWAVNTEITWEMINSGVERLKSTIDSFIEVNGLSPRKIIGMGFSQGGGALSVIAQREPARFDGIALLASFVIRDEHVALDGIPPVFVAHGEADEVVPLSRVSSDVEWLRERGVKVEVVTDDVGHKVGVKGMKGLKSWLTGFTLALFMLMVPPISGAQSRAFDCEGSKKLNKSELNQAQSKLQAEYGLVSSLKATFRQESHLASLDITEGSDGRMWFLKPGKMRWDYLVPEKQQFILDNDTMYLYQPEERQVVIDNVKKILITELPLAFLMGLGDLRRDFRLEGGCRSSDGIVLQMKPKKEGELEYFDLLIAENGSMPKGAKIKDSSGNVTAIVFSEIVKNSQVSDGDFKADFPKGTDVSDRRINE